MFREFIDVFENPTTFFQKERRYATGFVLLLIAIAVNAVMSELLIQYKFVDFGRILNPYIAIPAKFALSIAGYFIITGVCFAVLRLLGGRNWKEFYKVSAYSLVVLIFLWIPHMLVSAIVFAWFIMLMIYGMKQYNNMPYKKGIVIVCLFITLVVILSFVAHNYVPIFPYKIG